MYKNEEKLEKRFPRSRTKRKNINKNYKTEMMIHLIRCTLV